MTREEAIQILKESRITYVAPNGNELKAEALDMAISALQEPSDDIEGDIDFHCDLKHNKMTWFNNTTETQNTDKSESFADDLISRADLLDVVDGILERCNYPTPTSIGINTVKAIIKTMPSVSAERVVRCKDCKYNENGTCFVLMCVSFDDFFCGYAKMKGGTE